MAKIRLRRDTATNWENTNPVLALGEAGYDTTNNALRIGDGTTAWTGLTPIAGGAGDLGNLRIDTWGYPGDNPVRLTNQTPGESILVQSTDDPQGNQGRSSLRWHVRPEPDGDGSQYSQVDVQNDGVWIKNASWNFGGEQYYWHFDNNGGLTFPDGTVQTSAYVTPQQYGYINELTHPADNNSVYGEAVAMDADGNSYVSYSYYNDNDSRNYGGILKVDSTGAVVWDKIIQSSNANADYCKIASLEFTTVDGTNVLVAIGQYWDNNDSKDVGFMYAINPDNGSTGFEFDSEVTTGSSMRMNDAVLGLDQSNSPYAVLVGTSTNEKLQKSFTPLSPSTTDKLYISWADFNAMGVSAGDQVYYDAGQYYGAYLNGADSVASPDGVSGGLYLRISATEGGTYEITRVNGWSGEVGGWTSPINLRVLGSNLGGVDGVNDFTFDFDVSVFNNNSSNINAAVSNKQGTPITDVYCTGFNGHDWSADIGNQVTLNYNLSDQAYIIKLGSNSWTKNIGTSNSDYLNSVVVDSSENIYAVGYYYDNVSRGGLVIKYDPAGQQQWAVYVDPSDNMGITLYSVDLLSDGNLICVGDYGIVTKLDSGDGSVIWQVQLDSNNNISWDSDFKGAATPDGNYIFTNYEDNDYTMYVMCVSGTDGSELWTKRISRYFGGNNGEIYPQSDFGAQYVDCNSTHVTVAGTSYLYFNNNGNYSGFILNIPVNGENTDGTYGQYTISPQTLNWITESTTSVAATVSFETASEMVTTSSPTNSTGDLTPSVTVIGAVADTVFPGIERFSTTSGDNSIPLSADQNGQFLHYNGSEGNSWIYVPGNSDVALPIGFTVTIVMDNFNGNRIYVNNDGSDAQINAVGFNPGETNYWYLGGNGKVGVYTLMKVDTDRWILSGPDIQVD